MTKAGDVIENPVTGDRIVFLQTARETNGELLQFDEVMKAGGYGPPEHFHPKQHERFIVVTGKMGILSDGKEHILGEGEELTVPPGVRHKWWNASPTEELRHITEFRPALRFDAFPQTLFALGREKHSYSGLPLILQFSVLTTECPDNVYLASPPFWVQKIIYTVLAPIAGLLGYKDRYMRHAAPQRREKKVADGRQKAGA